MQVFNGTIKEISPSGLVSIVYDSNITNTTFNDFNSSSINITVDVKNEIPLNDPFNQQLTNFTWNITKAVNQTLEI